MCGYVNMNASDCRGQRSWVPSSQPPGVIAGNHTLFQWKSSARLLPCWASPAPCPIDVLLNSYFITLIT